MQGILCIPDGHIQTGSSPSCKNSVLQTNMDLVSELDSSIREYTKNQSNQSDSGILSGTGNSTAIDMNRTIHSENEDTDNRSNSNSPDRQYLCTICEIMLTSQHEFTMHIRSHNNETEVRDSEKGFTCRICFKVLSSNASLDRHMLIHSGERPFTCQDCGDTFTTNGNMHRHRRTHNNKSENYESDGSTDSGGSNSPKIEYNNNKIFTKTDNFNDSKRKCSNLDYDEPYKRARIKLENTYSNDVHAFSCPVCERNDFNSIDMLQIHLEDNHPDYPAKCNKCSQTFKNNKLLNEHKITVHVSEEKAQKNSVVGFKDLTFVDFSSQKFPYIAKYECEKNLHKVAGGLKFQCSKCSRAFPCASSLQIHHSNCVVGLDLSKKDGTNNKINHIDNDLRRNDFFARLDLQDNSTTKNEAVEKVTKASTSTLPTDSKDLADIQTIISMTTNGTLLQQLQTKPNDLHTSLRPYNENEESHKHENEEESQDFFAAEFRKMKVRGEFPCRLCTAVFPNLRALKGHNRQHLSGNNNGTYRCNMCPHSSIDKAALIRHMRTHNGDRPYECSLCNYAFTTKANCERHLRNRHAKTTREEVKKSIIYHPSEDPSNEEISKMLAREDKLNVPLKELNDSAPETVKITSNDNYLPTPDLPNLLPEKLISDCHSIPQNIMNLQGNSSFKLNNHHPLNRIEITDLKYNDLGSQIVERNTPTDEHTPAYGQQFNFSPKIINTSTPHKQPLKIKSLEDLQNNDYHSAKNFVKDEVDDFEVDVEDDPTDMALDLSTKKIENKPIEDKPDLEDLPQDLSKKHVEQPAHMSEILARQLLKNTPKIDPAGLYASQLAFYRNGFSGLHGLHTWPFSLNPLFFQSIPNPMLHQEAQDMKERLQRLQLCGGGMVMDNFTERLKNFQPLANPALNSFNYKINDIKPEISSHEPNFQTGSKSEEMKPLSLSVEPSLSDNLMKMQSPLPTSKPDQLSSPSSVKMVIKNGVLMPKQKQRRYRTERPFSCEYCSARFTLRSNMERHIKQQHPQYWSQRQRTNIGTGARKSSNGNHRNSFSNLNIPNYETQIKSDFDDIKDNHLSDKIKYVILAQHLKAAQNYKASNKHHKANEEEEDYPLIIDEKEENSKSENFSLPKGKAVSYGNMQNYNDKRSPNQDENPEKVQSANINKNEDAQDLVSVSRLLDNASQQPFKEYFRRETEGREGIASEEDEEGLVASSSTSDGNNSGTDENRSEYENTASQIPAKKKSAYSLAPNRVSCPYCQRKFPWTSSLRRHVLTHTGQKPFKCSHCPLLFTTKSNCDRHLLRKHGNSASAINNESSNTNSNYMMRNVPERPFKCSSCPSSTFSTYSNLKKHISCKHSFQNIPSDDARSQISTGYEAGSSEDEKMPLAEPKSDWDKQITPHNKSGAEIPNCHLQNSELPFKCHLCDNSFGERNDALDHMKERHRSEYELLLSKNALDVSATTPDENPNHDDNDDNEVRGKFPDYANRKVICAFCMRRFWSAEDLRRHMRTHTGERPFSCDICHRRFTLKHSMLRHRKKHNVAFEIDNVNSDEDANMHSVPSFNKFVKGNNNNLVSKAIDKTDESDGAEGSDLISNLLGIRDRSIIDQVLTSSADDAAKLLGVKGGEQE